MLSADEQKLQQCLSAEYIRQRDTRSSAGCIVFQHASSFYQILLPAGSNDMRVPVARLLQCNATCISGPCHGQQQQLGGLLGIHSPATFSKMAIKGHWLAAAQTAGIRLADIKPLSKLYTYLSAPHHGKTDSPQVTALVLQILRSVPALSNMPIASGGVEKAIQQHRAPPEQQQEPGTGEMGSSSSTPTSSSPLDQQLCAAAAAAAAGTARGTPAVKHEPMQEAADTSTGTGTAAAAAGTARGTPAVKHEPMQEATDTTAGTGTGDTGTSTPPSSPLDQTDQQQEPGTGDVGNSSSTGSIDVYLSPSAAAQLGLIGPLTDWLATDQQQQRYITAIGGSGIVATHFGLDINATDISTLKPIEWLNDEIVNMYMLMLQQHPPCISSRTAFSNSFFFTQLQAGYNNVKRWKHGGLCRGDTILSCARYDRLVIPVHQGLHRTLAFLDLRRKHVVYLDSLGGDGEPVTRLLLCWIREEAKAKLGRDEDMSTWQAYDLKAIPRQHNGVDCGVFTVMYANRLGQAKRFDFVQDNMPALRALVTCDILDGCIRATA